jgi:hypothetical protein
MDSDLKLGYETTRRDRIKETLYIGNGIDIRVLRRGVVWCVYVVCTSVRPVRLSLRFDLIRSDCISEHPSRSLFDHRDTCTYIADEVLLATESLSARYSLILGTRARTE